MLDRVSHRGDDAEHHDHRQRLHDQRRALLAGHRRSRSEFRLTAAPPASLVTRLSRLDALTLTGSTPDAIGHCWGLTTPRQAGNGGRPAFAFGRAGRAWRLTRKSGPAPAAPHDGSGAGVTRLGIPWNPGFHVGRRRGST